MQTKVIPDFFLFHMRFFRKNYKKISPTRVEDKF